MMCTREERRKRLFMSIVVGQIIETIFNFRQGSNTAKMVQFYEVMAPLADDAYSLSRLANNIFLEYGEALAECLTGTANFVNIQMIDRSGGLEEGSSSEPEISGLGGAVPAPSFVAIGFAQQRLLRTTRHGGKRVPFVDESITFEGQATDLTPTQEAALNDLFNGVISVSDAPAEFPTQLLRCVVIPRVPDASGGYVPDYGNPNPTGNLFNFKITSQNSRKVLG